MSEAKSEVKQPWTDEEFFAQLGREWLKLYKAQTGKDRPIGPEAMYTTEQGQAFLGQQYQQQVEKSDRINIKEDYDMLAYRARCALKVKYGIEA